MAFYASILIAHPPEHGKTVFYPGSWAEQKEDILFDDSTSMKSIKQMLLRKIAENPFLNPTECYTINSSGEYPYVEGCKPDYQKYVFGCINYKYDLLIRGLTHLLKSFMLTQHYFWDSASLEVHVALEATKELIFEKLIKSGNKNPSAIDAMSWLHEQIGYETHNKKYYEEYYSDRIKVSHPACRYGIYPEVPLGIDDCIGLQTDLVRNFELLITGQNNCIMNWLEKENKK